MTSNSTLEVYQQSADYRSYNPIKPVANKLLAKIWDDHNRDRHLLKLNKMKPSIDNKPPKTYTHLQLKLKKIQMEEDRYSQIQRSNRMLLEKISHIMKQQSALDNDNSKLAIARSLNKTKRQRELLRITNENQAILQRLESRGPYYNHLKWLEEDRINQTYLRNISAYPQQYQKDGALPPVPGSAKRKKHIKKNAIKPKEKESSEYEADFEDEAGKAESKETMVVSPEEKAVVENIQDPRNKSVALKVHREKSKKEKAKVEAQKQESQKKISLPNLVAKASEKQLAKSASKKSIEKQASQKSVKVSISNMDKTAAPQKSVSNVSMKEKQPSQKNLAKDDFFAEPEKGTETVEIVKTFGEEKSGEKSPQAEKESVPVDQVQVQEPTKTQDAEKEKQAEKEKEAEPQGITTSEQAQHAAVVQDMTPVTEPVPAKELAQQVATGILPTVDASSPEKKTEAVLAKEKEAEPQGPTTSEQSQHAATVSDLAPTTTEPVPAAQVAVAGGILPTTEGPVPEIPTAEKSPEEIAAEPQGPTTSEQAQNSATVSTQATKKRPYNFEDSHPAKMHSSPLMDVGKKSSASSLTKKGGSMRQLGSKSNSKSTVRKEPGTADSGVADSKKPPSVKDLKKTDSKPAIKSSKESLKREPSKKSNASIKETVINIQEKESAPEQNKGTEVTVSIAPMDAPASQ